jgi:hypothetical protein
MSFKLNNTDIRSIKVYDPKVVQTTTGLVANTATSWVYLQGGTFTKPSSTVLSEGVLIRNVGSISNAVISIEGKTAGTYPGSGATADGFLLATNSELFLPVNDLNDVVFKTSGSSVVGITLGFIAY